MLIYLAMRGMGKGGIPSHLYPLAFQPVSFLYLLVQGFFHIILVDDLIPILGNFLIKIPGTGFVDYGDS